MNKLIKAFLFTATFFTATAQAQGLLDGEHNRGLHMAIAMQGDQALLNIQQSLQGAIAESIRKQMDGAMPIEASVLMLGQLIELHAASQPLIAQLQTD